MPRTPMGFKPFEAFPFAEREFASRRPLPLWPLARTRQGLHRDARPAPGACSLRKSVTAEPRGPGGRLEAPLGFSPLQGFLPDRDGPRLPARLLSRAWPQPAPQSLDHDRAGSSPERPPPLLRFSHLVPAPVDSWLRRPGLMHSPRRQVISRFLCTPMGAVTQPLPQARRIGCRCRSRFVDRKSVV